MTDPKLCLVCHKSVASSNNFRRECSHVDCPVRPKAWADTMEDWKEVLGLESGDVPSSDQVSGD